MPKEFRAVNEKDISFFTSLLGPSGTFSDEENLEKYGWDYMHELFAKPGIILKPANPDEVSAILKYCNENNIAVSARGAGTSLSSAALPLYNGVVLSMERFNKIIHIDTENLQATLEPGVINEHFANEVLKYGLFYPPDPASKGSCFLGGNIAHSSGGPKAVKYGTTKEYVLNLEVVLPNGDIIWTGANTLKNSTGYNLTQLMIGSEGTLGIITKIVFKLIPKPKHSLLMLAAFDSAEKACETVSAIFREGITPSALEFMERDSIDLTLKHNDINISVPEWVKAHLLIEVDGNYLETLYKDCEIINAVLEKHECGDVLFAESDFEKEQLWRLRRKVAESVRLESVYKEEDTVVQRASLPQLLKGVKEAGKKYGFASVCYGHAGDGNLHVNILKGNMSDENWNHTIQDGIREIFELCKSLGGTISGEHGIGFTQKDYTDIVFTPAHKHLFTGIKKAFDPNGILNPGKIFD